MTLSRPRVALCAVAVAALLGGCGAADEGEVRNIGSEESTSGSASATGSGSASGSTTASGSGSAVSAAEQECTPVGTDLASRADATIGIALSDFAFVPDDIETDAGVVTFATVNAGGEPHELAFLPGGGEVPFTDEGEPDEEALAEAGAFELEAYGPGRNCNATYELEPGTYTLFCIVEAPDGETHYEKGMRGTLEVR